MGPEEYEQRRRALEAQLRADLELVRAGYEAKLRALEALRREAAAETGTAVPSFGGDDPRQEAAPKKGPPAAARPPAPPPPPVRRPNYEAMEGLADALPGLPAVFDKRDLVRALGYTPSRATLMRAIDKLLMDQKIRIVQHSLGGRMTQYERVEKV